MRHGELFVYRERILLPLTNPALFQPPRAFILFRDSRCVARNSHEIWKTSTGDARLVDLAILREVVVAVSGGAAKRWSPTRNLRVGSAA